LLLYAVSAFLPRPQPPHLNLTPTNPTFVVVFCQARIKRERAGFEDEQKDWERDMEADKVNLGTFFTDEEGKMARACGREIK
jgi:hypothetical protein